MKSGEDSSTNYTTDQDFHPEFVDSNNDGITMSIVRKDETGFNLEAVWPYDKTTKFLDIDNSTETNLYSPNTFFGDADKEFKLEYAEGGSWCRASVNYVSCKSEEEKREEEERKEEKKFKNSKEYVQTLRMNLHMKKLILDNFFQGILNEKGKKIDVDSNVDIKYGIEKLYGKKIKTLSRSKLKEIFDSYLKIPDEYRKLAGELLNYKSMLSEYKALTQKQIPIEKCSSRNNLGIKKSITRFSAKSKRNVQKKLSSIDQSKLTIAPQFLTLTWQSMPTSSEAIKIAFERWRRKFLNKFPEGCFFWRLEFSTAKLPRPHYHIIVLEVDLTKDKGWVSSSWHKSCYPSKSLQKNNEAHLRAGTSVEKIKSWKSVVGYSSKYVTKENDSTPTWWVGSRYWGVANPKVFNGLMSVKEIDLSEEQFVQIQKAMKDELNRRVIASARIAKKIIVDTEFLSSKDTIGLPYVDRYNKTDEVLPVIRHCYYSSDLSHMGYLVSNYSEDGYEVVSYDLVDDDGETLAIDIQDTDCRYLRNPQGSLSLSFYEGLPDITRTLNDSAGIRGDGR